MYFFQRKDRGSCFWDQRQDTAVQFSSRCVFALWYGNHCTTAASQHCCSPDFPFSWLSLTKTSHLSRPQKWEHSQYFFFFHVTARGRAVHQQQEAAVLVLRKYHKKNQKYLPTSQTLVLCPHHSSLGWRPGHGTPKFSLFPVVLRSESKIRAWKIKFWKEGLGGDFPSSVPVLSLSSQLCHPPLEGGLCRPGGSTTGLRFGRGAKFSAFREKLLMLWHLCCSYRSAMVWFS